MRKAVVRFGIRHLLSLMLAVAITLGATLAVMRMFPAKRDSEPAKIAMPRLVEAVSDSEYGDAKLHCARLSDSMYFEIESVRRRVRWIATKLPVQNEYELEVKLVAISGNPTSRQCIWLARSSQTEPRMGFDYTSPHSFRIVPDGWGRVGVAYVDDAALMFDLVSINGNGTGNVTTAAQVEYISLTDYLHRFKSGKFDPDIAINSLKYEDWDWVVDLNIDNMRLKLKRVAPSQWDEVEIK